MDSAKDYNLLYLFVLASTFLHDDGSPAIPFFLGELDRFAVLIHPGLFVLFVFLIIILSLRATLF